MGFAVGRGSTRLAHRVLRTIESILGKSIDIHGGGQDLVFPHHENELAEYGVVPVLRDRWGRAGGTVQEVLGAQRFVKATGEDVQVVLLHHSRGDGEIPSLRAEVDAPRHALQGTHQPHPEGARGGFGQALLPVPDPCRLEGRSDRGGGVGN